MTGAPLKKDTVAGLTLAAVGVVYGDIGTSPLYAFREALSHVAGATVGRDDIVGVLSLALWALIVIVTLKYVFFLTRMDNDGEGGVLSLMALARRASDAQWPIVLILGAAGAALFYGDAIITPALSVLAAVEGLKTVPGLAPVMQLPVVLGMTIGILIALFFFQSRGTAGVGKLFGPVCIVWFLTLGGLGLLHVIAAPEILAAFNPYEAVHFLATHGTSGLFVLGAVFLTVTGAEALIADMGHFGPWPIRLGWMSFVWPALTLNYLGQGALALTSLNAAHAAGQPFVQQEWFFVMAPDALRAPVVVLATLATIIASQAVITGAYSITRQAISLGLLPRMTIEQTSASQIGQIYIPVVNWMLLFGVLFLVLAFQSSSAMSTAYGIAVTGTMVITDCLAFVIAWKAWRWEPFWTAVLFLPFVAIDLVFLGANVLRIVEGGWVPLMVASAIGLIIAAWMRGRQVENERASQEGAPLDEIAAALAKRPPQIVRGTAVFLTRDLNVTPSALLHNLKHNKALHENNIVLNIENETTPHIPAEDRLEIFDVDEHFTRAKLRYGYMDSIDVPTDLARHPRLLAGTGGTSFFVGRNAIKPGRRSSMPRWMGGLFGVLHRNASDPTAFFCIPPNRVIELGSQIEL